MAKPTTQVYIAPRGAVMEKFAAGFNVVSALLFAGATAMLGFTIPGIWTLQSDMGSVKATLVTIDKRLDAIDKKLESIEGKTDQVAKRTDTIDLRMTAKDSDPSTIIAMSGLRPALSFFGIRIAQKIYALPRNDAAAEDLAKSGARREAITPSAFGYLLGNLDTSGRFVPANASFSNSDESDTQRK